MAKAIQLERMNATEAKNRFGDVLEKAADNRVVSLMKHGKAAAYVIPPALYESVRHHLESGHDPLQRLAREFDDMIAAMQEPASTQAAASLMTIGDHELQRSVRPQRPQPRRSKRAR